MLCHVKILGGWTIMSLSDYVVANKDKQASPSHCSPHLTTSALYPTTLHITTPQRAIHSRNGPCELCNNVRGGRAQGICNGRNWGFTKVCDLTFFCPQQQNSRREQPVRDMEERNRFYILKMVFRKGKTVSGRFFFRSSAMGLIRSLRRGKPVLLEPTLNFFSCFHVFLHLQFTLANLSPHLVVCTFSCWPIPYIPHAVCFRRAPESLVFLTFLSIPTIFDFS